MKMKPLHSDDSSAFNFLSRNLLIHYIEIVCWFYLKFWNVARQHFNHSDLNKDLQNDNSDTVFIAYEMKINYFMTKQVVRTFRKFFSLQFDTKFASKQQRLAKIGTILWLLLSTQISQVWHTTRREENAECDMHGWNDRWGYRPHSAYNAFDRTRLCGLV